MDIFVGFLSIHTEALIKEVNKIDKSMLQSNNLNSYLNDLIFNPTAYIYIIVLFANSPCIHVKIDEKTSTMNVLVFIV